jgi:hypothetical protein
VRSGGVDRREAACGVAVEQPLSEPLEAGSAIAQGEMDVLAMHWDDGLCAGAQDIRDFGAT